MALLTSWCTPPTIKPPSQKNQTIQHHWPARETCAGHLLWRPPMTENHHITEPDAAITLRPEDLDDLLTRAAERGAERCLAHLGLENGHAARDIRELRDLLEAWREARHTAWQTIIKVATTGLLAVILVGAAIKLKPMGGTQ
jgi:hypothetical protein